MTDTRPTTPSVVDRTRPVAAGAPVVAVAFPRRHRGLRARRGDGPAGRAEATSSAWRRMAAAFSRRPATASARHRRRRRQGGVDVGRAARAAARDRRQAPLDRSRRGRPGRRGGLVGRQVAFMRAGKGDPNARSRCLRPSAGSPSRRRACASRSRTTTACRCGFRTPRPRPRCSNGRARTTTWRSARTAGSWSPPCRSRAARLARRRRQAHADDRLFGAGALVRLDRGGKWLATSGSEQLVLWPFQSQGRPDGQAAAACSRRSRCG